MKAVVPIESNLPADRNPVLVFLATLPARRMEIILSKALIALTLLVTLWGASLLVMFLGLRVMGYEWRVLLAILCAGLISGQKMVWGIADWAWHHGGEIIELLQIRKRRIPSASTFYWVLQQVGIARLEAEVWTPVPDERLCQGTVLSREQFLVVPDRRQQQPANCHGQHQADPHQRQAPPAHGCSSSNSLNSNGFSAEMAYQSIFRVRYITAPSTTSSPQLPIKSA